MIKVLIRADDLGYSEGVNYGIAKSVKEGLIGSVGVMTNMTAVEHGLKLLEGEEVCLGQHTNICVGRPLTDPARIPSLTTTSGEFKPSSVYRSATEDFVVLDEAILEIEAQYRRFVELTGRQPGYFEGHAVASDNFFRGLEIVAKRHGLKYSGMSFGEKPIVVEQTEVYVTMDSMKKDYNPEQSLKDMVNRARDGECHMFICHPGYLDWYILTHSSMTTPRPQEVDMLCNPAVRRWLKEKGVEQITYDDL